MPKGRQPRHGTMQFWPRKRARRAFPRVRAWPESAKALPLGFAGYKAGMTTVMIIDNRKHSKTKGEKIALAATVIECPPLRVASVRLYKKSSDGIKVAGEAFGPVDKELKRTIPAPKKQASLEKIDPKDYDDIRILVYTQPKLTGIGKKKPELFELAVGGTVEERFAFAKEHLGKDLPVTGVLEEGHQLDAHAVTKGKGFQGPVKRFGISLKAHKSEKGRRRPGSLGGWKAQGQTMWRVAYAGQMGFHTRTEHNKWLLHISDNPEQVNPKGGFIRYGLVKNPYIIVKGSIQGPAKRLIRLSPSLRPNPKIPKEKPVLAYVSIESKQGN